MLSEVRGNQGAVGKFWNFLWHGEKPPLKWWEKVSPPPLFFFRNIVGKLIAGRIGGVLVLVVHCCSFWLTVSAIQPTASTVNRQRSTDNRR